VINEQGPNPAETYEQYLGPTMADPWTRVLLEYAAPQSRERVLDVACGTGTVARHVAPMVGTQGIVVALDINPAMLAVGRSLPAPAGASIEWREGDAIRLDLPEAVFDLVVCQQGLQFFPDRAAAVREMRRVLTRSGRVIVSVWESLERHPLYEALLTATARYLTVPVSAVDLSFSLSNADELDALLRSAGFLRTQVHSRSLDIHLPSPERFVQLTVEGAATSIATFTQLDAATRAALVDAVALQVEPIVRHYRDGDALTFPMFNQIAVAYST